MKRKVLSALLASAFVGVATTATAGVIQASYKNYAAEVFGDNTVTLTAPTINYSLALPLSGTATNPNSFTISWKLDGGAEWAALPPLAAIQLADPSNSNQKLPVAVAYGVSSSGGTDKTTLVATFTLNTGVQYTSGSQIVLGTTGALNIATVTKIGTTLGAPAANGCGNDVAAINVSIKLNNASGDQFDSNFPGNSNTTPLIQSKVALAVKVTNSSAYSSTVPTNNELAKVNVLSPVLGVAFTNDGDVTGAATTLINLGSVKVTDKTSGLYDLGGSVAYSAGTAGFGTSVGTTVGVVETNGLIVNVSGTFQNSLGATFFGSTTANCLTPIGTGVVAADLKSATLTLAAADMTSLAASAPVYLCYQVGTVAPNIKTIPTSSFQVTGGSLTKYAASLEANNSVCAAPIYNLVSNGVRVDVRNYIPGVVKAAGGANGWYSVIRIINTDATQAVSPTVQALLADGTLGASSSLDAVVSVNGTSGPLKALEARYYLSDKIDVVLNAAATTAKPSFGANDVGANARLRIVAPSSSIRVQNYIYNPGNGNFVEASSAQGDDGVIDTTVTTIGNTTSIRADGTNK